MTRKCIGTESGSIASLLAARSGAVGGPSEDALSCSIHAAFGEFLTNRDSPKTAMLRIGLQRPQGRMTMAYEVETNGKWRIASLFMTVVVVGGGIAFALSAG